MERPASTGQQRTDLVALILTEFRLEGEEVVRTNGRPMGHTVSSKGYRVLSVGRRGAARQLLYHRVKFCLLYGWLPTTVDHKDGDNSNNLSSNLRPATQAQQNRNRRRVNGPIRTSSLPRGVRAVPSGRFQAWAGGKYLGTFATALEASEVAESRRRELHGEFYARR